MAKRICKHDKQFKPKWRCGETKHVRIPKILESQVLELTKLVDQHPDPQFALSKLLETAKSL
jgi:hypothetical protein